MYYLRQLFVWVMSFVSFLTSPRRRRYLICLPPGIQTNYVLVRKTNMNRYSKFPRVAKLRIKTSYDFDTALQVFGGQDYDLRFVSLQTEISSRYHEMLSNGKIPLIFDVGANIGLATIFFLTEFPRARVIAVEPSSENIRLLRENLKAYGSESVTALQLAVTSQNGDVTLDTRAGNNAYKIQSGSDDRQITTETEVVGGVTLDDLIQEFDVELNATLILKIDVEGSEDAIFESTNCARSVPLIIVEPHDWLDDSPRISNFLKFHSDNMRLFRMRNENIFSLQSEN